MKDFSEDFKSIEKMIDNFSDFADAEILKSQKAFYDWDNRTFVTPQFLNSLIEDKSELNQQIIKSDKFKEIYQKVKHNELSWYTVFHNKNYEKIPEIKDLKNEKFFRLSDDIKYPPKEF